MSQQCLRTTLLQDHLAGEPALGSLPPLKCNVSHDPLIVCDKKNSCSTPAPPLDAAPHHPSDP